ncbi:MAG: RNA methyltransferase [Pseudomonadota bacterium]
MSEIVHRAHEDGPESVLEPATPSGLDRARLEDVLTYCAERQCESAHLTCPGCRLRRNQEGIDSLDAFARSFARIEAEETGLTIAGGRGEATHRVASLENLARDWAGEEYWFWARRVLRKVRYGVRQTDELLDAPFAASDAPSILLMEPQIAENIGMAARAMANFGLDDLHIIKPRDGWPSEKARAVASGASAIVDGAGVHDNLGEAISDLHWVAATTARQRDLRKPVLTPEQAAAEMRRRTVRGERCGILFGRERNGLQSDEVADCNAIVMIPVNRKFASLNLAQSVLLMGYAWLCSGSDATLGRVTDRERRLSTGLNLGHDVPAKLSDRERFFEHLETELDARGFFTPPERKPITVRNLRSMFLRADLTAQEVRTLRGIVVTLTRRPRNGHQSGQ